MADTTRVTENGTASPENLGPDAFVFRVGEVINSRFNVLRIVAQGGMGVVCEAFDNKLGERVALKWAKQGLGGHLPPEVRHAREITHPNVCKIFEIHTAAREQGSFDFISMEFIPGETLAARLRGAPLRRGEGETIVRQLCAGLAEAHRKNVIHGDLKSSNVILAKTQDGSVRAVITDFGLAQPRTVATAVGALTKAAGTPGYMAPELWKGAPASVGSDIYALGVILSELQAGARIPRIGTSERTLPWDEAAPNKQAHIAGKHNRIIARCLETDPERRFGSVDEIIDALGPSLRTQWAGRIGLALLLVILSGLAARWASVVPRESVRLAILPFAAETDLARLKDHLFTDASRKAAQIQGDSHKKLSIIPIDDVIRKKVNNPEQAVSLLRATHVLGGSLKAFGPHIRLHALITDGQSGTTLREWDIDYDRGDMRFAGDALAGLITESLHLPPPIKPTVNARAQADYLRGLECLRKDSTVDAALTAMTKAVRADPDSALTYAGLAEAQWWKYHLTHDQHILEAARISVWRAKCRSPDVAEVHCASASMDRESATYEVALTDLQRAIELEPGNADSYRRLGLVYQALNRSRDALGSFQRAIALEPQYYRTYLSLGSFQLTVGLFDEAIVDFRRAVHLSPGEAAARFDLGNALFQAGQFADAERELRQAIAIYETPPSLDVLGLVLYYQREYSQAIPFFTRTLLLRPAWTLPWLQLGTCYQLLGRVEDAEKANKSGLRLAEIEIARDPTDTFIRAQLAYLCAALGQNERAQSEILQALQPAPVEADTLSFAALTYELLGMREQTLRVLSKATMETLEDLNRLPDLAGLQQDPRFLKLLNLSRK